MRLLRLIGWVVSILAQRDAVLAGDRDRERAAVMLREHYAGGYLTLDELSHRTGRVLRARSRGELRRALSGLSDPLELVARSRVLAQTALRGVVLVAFAGAYLLFSLVLCGVLVVTLLVHGASASTLLAFLAVWLVPTYLLSRVWRRTRPN